MSEPLEPWEQLREEPLVRYKAFDVRRSWRRSPRTGAEIGFFLIDTWNWVNIVAITEQDEILLVRQYRHGTQEFTIEVPGGLLDPGEDDPIQAAARELREETGYKHGELRLLGVTRPNPAIFSNKLSTYLATDCVLDGELAMDAGEDIEVIHVPITELDEMLCRGEIDHSLVLASLHLFRLKGAAVDG